MTPLRLMVMTDDVFMSCVGITALKLTVMTDEVFVSCVRITSLILSRRTCCRVSFPP